MIFLVKERYGLAWDPLDPASRSDDSDTIRGYVEADTKKEAVEKVGEPANSWNTYLVELLEEHQRTA